jgi:ankyrin repeat protein
MVWIASHTVQPWSGLLLIPSSLLWNELKCSSGYQVPLWLDCGAGRLENVQRLLLTGTINIEHGHLGSTPLMNAAFEGHHEIVRLLLFNGADSSFVKKSSGHTSLISAVVMGRIEVMELLLEQSEPGLDEQDNDGFSALNYAAASGMFDLVKILVLRGAKVDMCGYAGNTTPLLSACCAGHYNIGKFLLEHGANASHSTFDGFSILHIAVCFSEGIDLLKLLIEGGADIDAKTPDNDTTLHLAVAAEKFEQVEYLLQRNVCMTFRNNHGKTPLDLAIDSHWEQFETDEIDDLGTFSVFPLVTTVDSDGTQRLVNILRDEQLRRERCEMFCMGQHERLGANSIIRWLDPEVTRLVVQWV